MKWNIFRLIFQVMETDGSAHVPVLMLGPSSRDLPVLFDVFRSQIKYFPLITFAAICNFFYFILLTKI